MIYIAVHPVLILIKGDGGPLQGEKPPSRQGRETTVSVRIAVGPIRAEADDTGAGGEEYVLGVLGTR